ncbi:hypothetical protein SAY86_021323 [Trapa natans]|uniref:Uncharacterized protein n=1 Tax=Trapa natans TaxID=22666 RepID=A0AAN7RK00_TRANT|nr:hypothetical protein SAY86_021323 [Trapa natans]
MEQRTTIPIGIDTNQRITSSEDRSTRRGGGERWREAGYDSRVTMNSKTEIPKRNSKTDLGSETQRAKELGNRKGTKGSAQKNIRAPDRIRRRYLRLFSQEETDERP